MRIFPGKTVNLVYLFIALCVISLPRANAAQSSPRADVDDIQLRVERYNTMLNAMLGGHAARSDLTTDSNLTEEQKELRARAFNAFQKAVSNSPSGMLFHDVEYRALTNAILSDKEIQAAIDAMSIDELVQYGEELYVGADELKDVHAAEVILRHVIERGNKGQQIAASWRLGESLAMPFTIDTKGAAAKAIPLLKNVLAATSGRTPEEAGLSPGMHNVTFHWSSAALAEAYRALGDSANEEKAFSDYQDALRGMGRSENAVTRATMFFKAMVNMREVPPDPDKMEEVAKQLDEIISFCEKHGEPVDARCKMSAEYLRRSARKLRERGR